MNRNPMQSSAAGPKSESMKNMNTAKLARLGLCTTIALIIFMIEAALPHIAIVPGMKLGLSNIVTLFVLKRYGSRDAFLVLTARIILAAIFAGQMLSFLFSVFGGFLALFVMSVSIRFLGARYLYLVSILGALAHNIGQIAAAFLLLKMSGIFAYLPYLMLSAVLTGLFNGLACYYMDRHIPDSLYETKR